MIKLFTLFNIAGLLLFNLFFAGDVSIVQDLPARMEPGTEVRVTVTVNKAQVSGFAKLQIDLPPGLSASAIETRGASFTFADGKAKFIWMALPAQPSFKVSYTLSADANASGTLPVIARLSYIEDNERKTADMKPATILVGTGAVAAQPVQEQQAHSNDIVSAAPGGVIPDAILTDAPGLPSQVGPGDVGATRKVTQTGKGELLVEVTVAKGNIRGFGKLQENLPQGFTALEKTSDDAIFSASGRMVKFVWLNLPSKNELRVSYRLIAPDNATGTYTINGEFGYLLNDLTQRAVVGSSSFNVDGTFGQEEIAEQQPAAPVPPTTTSQAPAPAPKATPPASTKPEPARAQAAPKATAPVTTPKATSTPAPEGGISFKVQITAAHREVGKPYFEQRHRYFGDFSIEHNEGWIKYVTGNFDRYRAARDQRQAYVDAQHNFPGPFVTAYNNGERITVQEALMIAKQSWVQ